PRRLRRELPRPPRDRSVAGAHRVPRIPMSFRKASILPGFGLTFGFTTFFLSVIVLLPLAALTLAAASMHWSDFVHVVLSPRALGSYRLSFGASFLAAAINLVFGLIIAWTLVRYEFPARKLIDALIDMPFALPTAVSGIALTTVFAHNGWIGRYLEPWGVRIAYTWLGVTLALTLITMPFVVRAVQPALLEVQRDLEDAAETLGAGRDQPAAGVGPPPAGPGGALMAAALPAAHGGDLTRPGQHTWLHAIVRWVFIATSLAFLAALLLAPLATVFAMAFQRGLYAY